MGILHYLGLREQHKGIFDGLSLDRAIEILSLVENSEAIKIVEQLKNIIILNVNN